MRLSVRYENKFQTIELNEKEVEEMWISLSLEGEEVPKSQKEQLIQNAFNEEYNKPEYNNWHKFDRHWGYSKAKPNDEGEEIDTSEPLMKEVADDRVFRKDETIRDCQNEYQDVCQWIRSTLSKKPEWAEAFIAVRIDGIPIREYANSIGADENNITQKLKRATKKLQEEYQNRQI
jgi:arylsulfatase A-like enzyme